MITMSADNDNHQDERHDDVTEPASKPKVDEIEEDEAMAVAEEAIMEDEANDDETKETPASNKNNSNQSKNNNNNTASKTGDAAEEATDTAKRSEENEEEAETMGADNDGGKKAEKETPKPASATAPADPTTQTIPPMKKKSSPSAAPTRAKTTTARPATPRAGPILPPPPPIPPSIPTKNLTPQQLAHLQEFTTWIHRWNNYQHQLAHYWHGRYQHLHKSQSVTQQHQLKQFLRQKELEEIRKLKRQGLVDSIHAKAATAGGGAGGNGTMAAASSSSLAASMAGGQEEEEEEEEEEPKTRKKLKSNTKHPSSKRAVKWDNNIQLLLQFKERYGHTNVPKDYIVDIHGNFEAKGIRLGQWVKRLKMDYKQGKLKQEKIDDLVDIGFSFLVERDAGFGGVKFISKWERSFAALKKYKEEHGNIEVPSSYISPHGGVGQLDKWILRQRTLYKKDQLPLLLANRLKELGVNLNGRGTPYGFPLGTGLPVVSDKTHWMNKYEELTKYHEENGNADVAKRYLNSHSSLGKWVDEQRQLYADGKLDKAKINLLEKVGFNFLYGRKNEKSKDPFSLKILELKAYRKVYGHYNVPKNYEANYALGAWLHNQKLAYRDKKLSEEHLGRLKEIGFDFKEVTITKKRAGKDARHVDWHSRYEELKEFYAQNDDSIDNLSGTCPLGRWLSRQRGHYKDGRLTEEKVEKLKELGVEVDVPSTQEENKLTWEENYEELKKFEEEFGHTAVPNMYKPNPRLYFWCGTQRQAYKKGKLSDARKKLLEDIGFSFKQGPQRKRQRHNDSRKSFLDEQEWEHHFKKLQEYKEKHGDVHVPQRYEPDRLGSFVHFMRYYYRAGKLTADQIARLERVGFVFNMTEDRWNSRYDELKEYKEKNGNCDVPHTDRQLGAWVYYQRRAVKKKNLSDDKIQKLKELGFNFSNSSGNEALRKKKYEEKKRKRNKNGLTREETWDAMFERLFLFKEEHGHAGVPITYPKDRVLAKWVSYQRTKYRQGNLSDECVDRLKEIGFNFGIRGNYKPEGIVKTELNVEAEDREVYLQKLWDSNFELLKQYAEEHGNCAVPINYEANPSLGAWAFSQKMAYKKKKLSDDRIERLTELGFF